MGAKLVAVLADVDPELLAGTRRYSTPPYAEIAAEISRRDSDADPHDSGEMLRILTEVIAIANRTEDWFVPLPNSSMTPPESGLQQTPERQFSDLVLHEIYNWMFSEQAPSGDRRTALLLALEHPWRSEANLAAAWRALCKLQQQRGEWPFIEPDLTKRVGWREITVATRHYISPLVRIAMEGRPPGSGNKTPKLPSVVPIARDAPAHLQPYFRDWSTLLSLVSQALRQLLPPALVDGSSQFPYVRPALLAPNATATIDTPAPADTRNGIEPNSEVAACIKLVIDALHEDADRGSIDSALRRARQLANQGSDQQGLTVIQQLIDFVNYRLHKEPSAPKNQTVRRILLTVARPLAAAFASMPEQQVERPEVVAATIDHALDFVLKKRLWNTAKKLQEFHGTMLKLGWAPVHWPSILDERQIVERIRCGRYLMSAHEVRSIVERAIDEATGMQDRACACAIICFAAGLRISEVNFRIRDLCPGRQAEVAVRDHALANLKTDYAVRCVPLHRLLPQAWCDFLLAFRATRIAQGASPDDVMLCAGDSLDPINHKSIYKYLYFIQEALFGQVLESPHGFRHSLASRLFLVGQLRAGCPTEGPSMHLIEGDWLRPDSLINRLGVDPVLSDVGMDVNAGWQPFLIAHISEIMGHVYEDTTLSSYILNTPEIYLLWQRRLQPKPPVEVIQRWASCGKSAAYEKRRYWLDYSPESVLKAA